MGKVTSKYQVSIPRTLAEQLRIEPGDDLAWRILGDELRVVPAAKTRTWTVEQRLALFDAATRRQATRNRAGRESSSRDRGWTREELYERGRTR
ncbi:MAG TPA: AbrB/MazE/SpoVT family DNA-binding domain-containing protein [Thermoanaerobaculia bacterium]|nr:AbrB/MazE/SpoVT family DNA-binding domain-containing protein [Thermoanaerobaculia bacterium]